MDHLKKCKPKYIANVILKINANVDIPSEENDFSILISSLVLTRMDHVKKCKPKYIAIVILKINANVDVPSQENYFSILIASLVLTRIIVNLRLVLTYE